MSSHQRRRRVQKVKDDPKQKKITSFLQPSPDITFRLPAPAGGQFATKNPGIDLDMAYEEKLRELETVRKLHQQKEKDALRFELENAKLRQAAGGVGDRHRGVVYAKY